MGAKETVEPVLAYLEVNPKRLYILGGPWYGYLCCYRVLESCQDPRASTFLDHTHTLLQEAADKIDIPEWRQSFLENVATNREIVQLWMAQQ